MNKVLDIAYKEAPGKKMIQKEEVYISEESGIQGDCRGTVQNAQITILDKSSWEDACDELNIELSWIKRRTNILVDNIDLINSLNKKLYIGKEVILKITGECKPCSLMEKTYSGLFDALSKNWRGGVETIVLKGGTIKIGDIIRIR